MRWGPLLPHDCYVTSYSYRTEKKSALAAATIGYVSHGRKVCESEKLPRTIRCCSVMPRCASAWLVYLGSIKALLPRRLLCHNKITGLQHPTGCAVDSFFSFSLSKFAAKIFPPLPESMERKVWKRKQKRFQLYFFLPASIFRHILWKYNSRKERYFLLSREWRR